MHIDLVERISIAKDFASRFDLISELESVWRRPISANDGYAEAEIDEACRRLNIRIPAALREFYRRLGSCFARNRQDNLLPLKSLSIDQDRLTFYSENQGVCWWVIKCADLVLDDPPVFYCYDEEPELENGELSEFLLQSAISEYKWHGETVWGNPISTAALERLTSEAKRLPLPDFHWPVYPTSLWQYGSVLVQITPACPEAWAGSKNEQALADFAERFKEISWE